MAEARVEASLVLSLQPSHLTWRALL